jgi:hypothetical protein
MKFFRRSRGGTQSGDANAKVVSRFGAFGPGTGAVVAFVDLTKIAPASRWRMFATLMSGGATDEQGRLNPALERLRGAGQGYEETLLMQAEQWAHEALAAFVRQAPDSWFDFSNGDGEAGVPSHVKAICVDRLALSATGLAGLHIDPSASATCYGAAASLVPIHDVFSRGPRATHPALIDPYEGHASRRSLDA